MSEEDFKVHLGHDNVPFFTRMQQPPYYKNGLPQRLQPRSIRKVRVDVLDLSDDEQYNRYLRIWDAVGYGVATVADEERRWVESKENWLVFIRWFFHGKMDNAELRKAQMSSITDLQRAHAMPRRIMAHEPPTEDEIL